MSVAVRQNDEGTFLGQVDGLEYSVFRYRYEVVGGAQEIEGCLVASLEDIGAMKLSAICQRSVKRDYVDLHAILTRGRVSLGDLVPEMLLKTSWEKVKADLEKLAARHLR